jgi:hypothetical protein
MVFGFVLSSPKFHIGVTHAIGPIYESRHIQTTHEEVGVEAEERR